MWIAQYDKGDHAERHYHYPLDWSAVYYINVEDNASPIIFGEDVKVQPENNMMLLFPGWLNHRVPKTKSKRTLIAMNFQFSIFIYFLIQGATPSCRRPPKASRLVGHLG